MSNVATTGKGMSNKQRTVWKKIQKRWQLYLLLLIPLIYIIVFAYVPMGGLVIAFKKYDFSKGIFGSPWVGLANFEKFISSYKFGMVLKNTLTISLYSLLTFPIAIIFALLLNAFPMRRYKKSYSDNYLYPSFYFHGCYGWPDFSALK